jgi:hypothetical protein
MPAIEGAILRSYRAGTNLGGLASYSSVADIGIVTAGGEIATG